MAERKHTMVLPAPAAFAFHRFWGRQYVRRCDLGRGQYGTVFAVDDKETGETFVVKQIPKITERGLPSEDQVRDEVQVLQALGGDCNPFAVCLVDVQQDYANWYLFMRLLGDFVGLDRLIGTYQFTEDNVLDIAQQLFHGLAALHRLGIAHRDIKPSNIMVQARPNAYGALELDVDQSLGSVRFIDFGLSCAGPVMCAGQPVARGAAGAVAPELWPKPSQRASSSFQQRARPRTTDLAALIQADLWSLGLVIVELVASFLQQDLPLPLARQRPDALDYFSVLSSLRDAVTPKERRLLFLQPALRLGEDVRLRPLVDVESVAGYLRKLIGLGIHQHLPAEAVLGKRFGDRLGDWPRLRTLVHIVEDDLLQIDPSRRVLPNADLFATEMAGVA